MIRRRFRVPLVVAIAVSAACGDERPTDVPRTPAEPRRASLTVVGGDGQSGEVGTPLAQPVVLELRDTLAVLAPGVVVRFHDERDTLVDSATTNDAGRVSVAWTVGRKAGAQQVRAVATLYGGRANGNATDTFTVTGRPGPIARVDVTLLVGMALPGSQLDTVVATVTDRFDNPIADAEVQWAVGSGGGSIRAVTTRTDQRGTVRAIWTIGSAVGENTLTATAAGVTGRASALGSEGMTATTVAAGGTHTCALDPAGYAYCWGSNTDGQLGRGVMDDRPHTAPERVIGGLTFTSLTAGAAHTCGLTASGEAYCWGLNSTGQLGSGSRGEGRPAVVSGSSRFTAIAAGNRHTCGLRDDGAVLCWGDNAYAQLGRGDDRSGYVSFGEAAHSVPAPIASGPLSFTGLAASSFATCAIERSGDVYCWGINDWGNLGAATSGRCGFVNEPYMGPPTTTLPCSTTPLKAGVRASVSVIASPYYVCALASDGEVACWGQGPPPRVVTGARVSAAWPLRIAVCGSVVGGGVSCWSLIQVGAPEVHPFGTGVSLVALTAGGGHECGVSADTQRLVYCLGSNYFGELGDGTTAQGYSPVRVVPPISRR